MGWAVLGLLVLVVYPLVQIPAVLYLSRYYDVDDSELVRPPVRDVWLGDSEGGRAPPSRVATPVCSRCGARNDPDYAYCQRCVAPL